MNRIPFYSMMAYKDISVNINFNNKNNEGGKIKYYIKRHVIYVWYMSNEQTF